MNLLNRRGFVKTLLATAASASPACASLQREMFYLGLAQANASSTNLANGEQQLRLSPVGTRLIFQNFLRTGDGWKPATLANIPLVAGASFPLVTARIRRDGLGLVCEGTATAESLDGKQLGNGGKGG